MPHRPSRSSFLLRAALALCASLLPAQSLKVGYLPITGHAKFFVAKDYGMFAKEGLDVELIEFQNSADGITALRAGKIDLGAFGTMAPLIHIDKGADLRIIGGVMGGDASIVESAAQAANFHGIKDLKGRKIATVRLASGDAVLRGALAKAGLNWKRDVQIFELKNPSAVIEAVKSGQVDAGVVWGPHDLRAQEQGLKVVLRSKDLSPGHPCCRLTVEEKSLASHPQVWEHFLRAILLAEKFTREHHPETIAAIHHYVKLEPALLEKGYYSDNLDQSSDPNANGVAQFWATMQADQLVESKQPIQSHIDASPYKKALDGLAKENPKDPYWQQLKKSFKQRNG